VYKCFGLGFARSADFLSSQRSLPRMVGWPPFPRVEPGTDGIAAFDWPLQ